MFSDICIGIDAVWGYLFPKHKSISRLPYLSALHPEAKPIFYFLNKQLTTDCNAIGLFVIKDMMKKYQVHL